MSAIGPKRTYASLVVKKTRVGHESFRFCMHCSSRHRSHWRVCARRHTRFGGSGVFDFGCTSWSVVDISPVFAIGPKRTWAGALHMSAFDPKRTWARPLQEATPVTT